MRTKAAATSGCGATANASFITVNYRLTRRHVWTRRANLTASFSRNASASCIRLFVCLPFFIFFFFLPVRGGNELQKPERRTPPATGAPQLAGPTAWGRSLIVPSLTRKRLLGRWCPSKLEVRLDAPLPPSSSHPPPTVKLLVDAPGRRPKWHIRDPERIPAGARLTNHIHRKC